MRKEKEKEQYASSRGKRSNSSLDQHEMDDTG